MKFNINIQKGISLVSLVITIIIIIILTGIVSYYSIENLKKAADMEIAEEIRNVEEVVLRERARIISGTHTTNTDYIITEIRLTEMLDTLSDQGKKDEIWDAITVANYNNSDEYKYYLLNAENYSAQIGDDLKILNLKGEYIVNYGLGTVIFINEESVYISGELYK